MSRQGLAGCLVLLLPFGAVLFTTVMQSANGFAIGTAFGARWGTSGDVRPADEPIIMTAHPQRNHE